MYISRSLSKSHGGGVKEIGEIAVSVGRKARTHISSSKPSPGCGASKKLHGHSTYLLAYPENFDSKSVISVLKKVFSKKGVTDQFMILGNPFLGARKAPEGTKVLAIIKGKKGQELPTAISLALQNEFPQPINVHPWHNLKNIADSIEPFIGKIIKKLGFK